MRRSIVVLVLITVAAAGFALDVSAGGGLSLGGTCARFSAENYPFGLYDTYQRDRRTVPFGFTAAFDATYVEASLGLAGSSNLRTVTNTASGGSTSTNTTDLAQAGGYLTLSLLGKYPFALGPLSLFPLLGIQYDLNLWLKDENGDDLRSTYTAQELRDANSLWFRFGVGAQYPVGKRLRVLAELTAGFKPLTAAEQQDVDTATASLGADSASGIDSAVDFSLSVRYLLVSAGRGKR